MNSGNLSCGRLSLIGGWDTVNVCAPPYIKPELWASVPHSEGMK